MTMSKEARENIEQLHSRLDRIDKRFANQWLEWADMIKEATTRLDCREHEIIEELERLLLVERWLFNECKEPARSEALEWLGKFGYKEDE